MAKRKSSSFLPKFLQTKKNEKFLHATLDQLLNSKSLERIDGYVGRRRGPSYGITDPYISTVGSNRQNYQLEPSVTYKNNGVLDFVITYDDILSQIESNGGNNLKHDRLFKQEYYNWSGFVDYDKLINFGEYYWMPAGPGVTTVSASLIPVNETYTISQANNDHYRFAPTYGESNNPTIYLVRGGSYTFNVDQNSRFFIQTEPGTSGKSTISFNRSTRDIYGLTNNGASNGTMTFNVPNTTDQDFFTRTLTNVAAIDLASDLTYNQIQGSTVDALQALGGVDGQLYFDNKTIIFTHDAGATNTWPAEDGPSPLSNDEKLAVYRILVSSGGNTSLLKIQDIGINQKVQINEGELHSTKEYYRTSGENKFKVVPLISAPFSTLYYQDDTTGSRLGEIKLLDAGDRFIDITTEVLKKEHYTSPNGVTLTNGMHIQFDSTVMPVAYQNKTYIVDGVGEGIILIEESSHESHELASTEAKDYMSVRRGSVDSNAWSRSNHWYHKEVVNIIADYNNVLPVIDQKNRANRPIIEFNRNLQLFNSGNVALPAVDLIDTLTTDALSTVQNSSGYIVDGVPLTNGMTIIFASDTNITVRNKVYTVNIVDFEDDSQTEVTLVPSTTDVVDGDVTVAKQGTVNKGKTYYWRNDTWNLAQQKSTVNQAPLFDVFDNNGVSYADDIVYLGNNFRGSKLFAYALGTGASDIELGFALKYRNFSNIGDIVFDNTYSTDSFIYTAPAGSTSIAVNTGFIKLTDKDRVINYVDGWTKVKEQSTQRQEVTYVANGGATRFDIGTAPKKDSNGNFTPVVVYLNGLEVKTGYSYKFVNDKHVVEFETAPAINTHLIFEVNSNVTSDYGVYQIPVNLSNNAFNTSFDVITLGQMRNHVGETLRTADDFIGQYPGSGNLRDVTNSAEHPGNILHHSAGMVNSAVFLQHGKMNFIDSIEYNASEYTKFKQKFMQAAETLDVDFENISDTVDTILSSINSTKSSAFPFYYSDMIPHGTNKKIRTYTITDNRQLSYQFETTFNLNTNTSRAVLVYRNDVQLIEGADYTFEQTRPAVTFTEGLLSLTDVIKIVEYENTAGNYIPQTPTKLGLYPKYEPTKYTDKTYVIDVEMIQGHDGSLTRAYGGVLDDVLLELEKRIYNNIKSSYKSNVFDFNEVIPGRWRDTDYTTTEKNTVLAKYFLKWAIKNRIDWTTHVDYEREDRFTWNYNQLTDRVNDQLITGGWRGAYWDYYDTDRPHTHPWEMLGFSVKPSWWATRYGPSPYTSGNLVMWEDLRDGKVYDAAGNFTVNELYKRDDLISMIPVDGHGTLLAPWDVIAKGSTVYEMDAKWTANDFGPAQSAWRKSSEWPFMVQIACALMRPAKYFGLMYDTDTVIRSSLTGNIVNTLTNKQVKKSDYVVPYQDQTIVNGYSSYVANYMQFLGVDLTVLEDVLDKVDINLSCKLSAYTDKKMLKVLAEQVSPNAVSENVMVPDEDYELFVSKTGPVISAAYSGVIVQLTDTGYAIYGYNTVDPFFTVLPTIQTNRKNTHNVLDDSYIEYLDHKDTPLRIPYGTEMSSPQQVFDFLVSYGRYLTALGYDFDNSTEEIVEGNVVANWTMSAKEFAYWKQQRWGVGAVISLSPSANFIQFKRDDGMVDSMVTEYNRKTILNQNFDVLGVDNYRTNREDGLFELSPDPASGGVYFADVKTVQYEHTLVLNNTTIFNDIIYQPELGNRQNRLRLVGWRTNGWDGSLTAQGFILNRGAVDQWVQNTDYSKGAIVKYNDNLYTSAERQTSGLSFDYTKWSPTDSFKLGLLPNWDTLGGNFESFYNIDDVNLESSADAFGKSITGYQSRDYLTNLGLDDTSQIKFYQGFIKEKGTTNAIDKLLRASLDNISSDIDMYEEWAIRSGEYGGTDINRRIEILLNDNEVTGNPFVIHGIASIEDKEEGVMNLLPSKLYKAHPSTTHNWIPTNDEVGLQGAVLPYAGYAKLTDADATLFNLSSYQNLDAQVGAMKVGYTLYVANDDNNDWNMFYLDDSKELATSITASDQDTLLWSTKENHNMQDGQVFVVTDAGGGTGVHRVMRSTGLKTFETNEKVEGLEFEGESVIFKFNSIRFSDTSRLLEFAPSRGWKLNDKLFVDSYEDKWTVFKKENEYGIPRAYTPRTYNFADGHFGSSIAVNSDMSLGIFGMPNIDTRGGISIYIPNVEGILAEATLLKSNNTTDVLEFGKSVAIHGQTFAVGAPGTSTDNGAVFVYTRNTQTNSYDISTAFSLTGLDAAITTKTADNSIINTANSTNTTGRLGEKVRFSGDGKKLFVSAPRAGVVYVFSLIGSGPKTIDETFAGDGINLVFEASADVAGRSIAVDGVVKIQGIDYTVIGSTITFVSPPQTGDNVTIIGGTQYVPTGAVRPSTLEAGFGSSIDTTADGKVLVVGSPNETNTFTQEGSTYVYNLTGTHADQLADNSTIKTDNAVFTADEKQGDTWELTQRLTLDALNNQGANYGMAVAITDDGLRLFSSAPCIDRAERSSGLVVQHDYNATTSTWDLTTNIAQNATVDGQQFGGSLDISGNGTTLAIGATTDTFKETAKFDAGDTTYDGSATQFIDDVARGGNVYVYQGVNKHYVQVQKLDNTFIDTDDRFGSEIQIVDNTIFVGMPLDDNTNDDAGRVFEYSLADDMFVVNEQESQLVDFSKINKVYTYSKVRNEVIEYYDWIDPIKGKVPGLADENIDYKTLWDPAHYTTDRTKTWGKDNVGKIWWDLSKVKYLYAEQSDWAYRSTFWGAVFPGSVIDCYEWIESTVPPSSYEGDGVVLSAGLFTANIELRGQVETTKYYYWVKNRRDTADNKTASTYDIAQIIADPQTYGIKFASFISETDVAMSNIIDNVSNDDTVLVVDYDLEKNNQLIHSEWSLFKENYTQDDLPANIRTKLFDSLVGSDTAGNSVPSTNLSFTERYGVQFRPRQSMFVNRKNALKVYVEAVNTVLSKSPIAITRDISPLFDADPQPSSTSGEWDQKVANQEELGFVRVAEKTIGHKVLIDNDDAIQNLWSIYELQSDRSWTLVKLQSYDVTTQWNYADWYDTGFDSTTYIKYQVELVKDLVNITPAAGDVVRINNGGNWELQRWNGVEYIVIAIKNGTIKLASSLYDYTTRRYGFDSEVFDYQLYDQEPQIETRKIIETIYSNIFTESLTIENNRIFQQMIYYVLDEQPYVDWLFKTSFISVFHNIRALDALPYYRRDNQDYVKDFINEAKPYHTKIREYVLNYNKTDPYDGDVTDFDVHSYYDAENGYYRKPNSRAGDADLLSAGVNLPFSQNYTFELGEVVVYDGGSDYVTAPEVTITGGGGTGATAQSTIDGSGSVTLITVTNPGTGYITTPTVEITSSTGTTAIAYARLSNAKVRTFDTTMKFDRTLESSNTTVSVESIYNIELEDRTRVSEWTPSTTYLAGDVVTNSYSVVREPIRVDVLTDVVGARENVTIPIQEEYFVLKAFTSSLFIDQDINAGKLIKIDPSLKYGRLKNYSDIKDWKPNTAYTTGTEISHLGEAYRVIENFTSGPTFTSDSLAVIADETFDNAMDRTMAFYQPTQTQAAKELENIFSGIEYPNNRVTGPDFNLEPGFGRSGFDSIPYDNFEIGGEGIAMLSGVVDTTITASNIPISGLELESGSYIKFDYVDAGYAENTTVLVEGVTVADVLRNRFGNSLLGTRPEDIDITGGKFVDQYSSHAPEETVPGRVFDSLDIEVYQTPSSIDGNKGLSPRIDILKHEGDGSTTKFSFLTADGSHSMNLLIYTAQTGKVQPDEFTVNWTDFTVNFITPPAVNDIVDIINIGNTGENMVLDVVFKGDGSSTEFILPLSYSLARQSLVLIDGVKTDHTLTEQNSSRAVLNFDTPPGPNAHVHVFVFNLDPATEIAYSHVAQELFTMDGSTRTFTLAQQPFYDAPTDAKVYVELQEGRLRPAAYTYANGDGGTTTFELTSSADIDHRTITASDLSVFVAGASNTDWTLDADDGSSARTITFTSAPTSGAVIAIGDNTNAEYSIVGSNITIASGIAVPSGAKLNITSFSNHDSLQMTAETFVGLESSEVTLKMGYDVDVYDTIGFDGDDILVVNSPTYTLHVTPQSVNYLWVTLNSVRLSLNHDFEIQNDKLLIKRSISATDVLVVNHFSENTIKHRIAWRMWQDVIGRTKFYRMIDDATTVLTKKLSRLDVEIEVKDGSKLADPSPATNTPGVVFIGSERVTYWTKDGNILKDIRRGTMGTGVAFAHYIGDTVMDTSVRQEVPSAYNNVWYDDITVDGSTNTMTADNFGNVITADDDNTTNKSTESLQYQTTQQANFLNQFVGTVPVISVAFDQTGRFIAPGYVLDNYVIINE